MLEGLAADTSIIIYLMTGIGVLGILAKIVNQFTLRRLVKAAGNMPKSTHRLIKLVRAKYEHACMIHDSVENIDAFVEKYIYEYRGFLFRIHTWRQIEILCVWFAGILAALGAWMEYTSFGVTEIVYQYVAAGAAEVVLLSVVMRLSDEPYKINAVKMYMIDYLDNICAFRLKKQSQREREFIDVIAAENGGKNAGQTVEEEKSSRGRAVIREGKSFDREPVPKDRSGRSVLSLKRKNGRAADEEEGIILEARGDVSDVDPAKPIASEGSEGTASENGRGSLPINIEGEPRNAQKGDAARQAVRSAAENAVSDEERTALREEAIRQILEEFLA